MERPFLPYGRQEIDDTDREAVLRALGSGLLTTGPEVPAFENEFAAFCGARHAVACANGTAALHLALDALGVGAGDVCIVPAITFMATANAALYCGAQVVFADVDPDTGLMTPETFKAALLRAGDAARAVLPVHLAGEVCDMDAIAEIARARDLKIVEDSCHALGSTDAAGALIGGNRLCDAATFSFHPVKTIACGEGGMITTPDPDLDARMRRRRSHGIERDPALFTRAQGAQEPWWHEMTEIGWNHRLSDLHAALGRSQLARLPAFIKRRRALAARYAEALAPLAPVVLPPAAGSGRSVCRHLMNVRIDFETAAVSRAQVMQRLKDAGVGSQVHYIPVYRQPVHARANPQLRLPGAEAYYARTLSLPLFAGMSDDDPDRVCDALSAAITR